MRLKYGKDRMGWLSQAKGYLASLETLYKSLKRHKQLEVPRTNNIYPLPDEECLKTALLPLARAPTVDPKPPPAGGRVLPLPPQALRDPAPRPVRPPP